MCAKVRVVCQGRERPRLIGYPLAVHNVAGSRYYGERKMVWRRWCGKERSLKLVPDAERDA